MLIVANHNVASFKLAVLPIQRLQRFPGLGQACCQDFSRNMAFVVGVNGLAILQHHIIGRVDDGVDGTHSCSSQSLLHPSR